jgi:hypothetical protein
MIRTITSNPLALLTPGRYRPKRIDKIPFASTELKAPTSFRLIGMIQDLLFMAGSWGKTPRKQQEQNRSACPGAALRAAAGFNEYSTFAVSI